MIIFLAFTKFASCNTKVHKYRVWSPFIMINEERMIFFLSKKCYPFLIPIFNYPIENSDLGRFVMDDLLNILFNVAGFFLWSGVRFKTVYWFCSRNVNTKYVKYVTIATRPIVAKESKRAFEHRTFLYYRIKKDSRRYLSTFKGRRHC